MAQATQALTIEGQLHMDEAQKKIVKLPKYGEPTGKHYQHLINFLQGEHIKKTNTPTRCTESSTSGATAKKAKNPTRLATKWSSPLTQNARSRPASESSNTAKTTKKVARATRNFSP